MDLVEIRKKAKGLKGSKNKKAKKSKEHIKSADGADEQATPLEVEEVNSSTGDVESSEAFDVTEDTAAGGLLSDAIDDLYATDYEVDEEELEEDRLELLCFRLSDEEYAININSVSEIVKMIEVTEVPKAHPSLLGIISLRGIIIPLLDLRKRLGLETKEYDSRTRIIVVFTRGERLGMVVDGVTEVVRLKHGVLEPPPSMLTSIDTEMLEGVGRHEEKLLIVPNLDKVFDINK